MSIGLALGGLSILGNIYGGIKSAQQNKEIDELLAGRMNDLQSRFDKDYNTNFLDTDHAKSVIKTLSKQHGESLKKVDNAGAITGASQEAKIAARESSQGKFDDALTSLAGYGTQYKDMKEREFNRRDDSLQNIFLQHQMNKGGNWTNLMGNATNLGQTGIMAEAMGGGGGVNLSGLFGMNSLKGGSGGMAGWDPRYLPFKTKGPLSMLSNNMIN